MAKKYSELRARMAPEAQAKAAQRALELAAEMPLQELRQARRLSQETLADSLGISQPQVSKIEHRTDLYVSTLRRYVEAMGGTLSIVAHFAEGWVRITQFGALEPAGDEGHGIGVTEHGTVTDARWEPDLQSNWTERLTTTRPMGWHPRVVQGGRGVAC